MQQRPDIPPPSYDPLAGDEETPRSKTADLPPEDGHDLLQKGMPGRNMKTWGVAALGIIVVAALVWPNQNANKQEKIANPSNQNIADELAQRVQPDPPEIKFEQPAPPPPPAPAQKIEPKDDDRMMMILASPMGADLDMRNGSGGNRNKSQQNNATDPLAELDRMRAAMMQGNNFAAADGDKPVAKSSGLHGDFLKQSKDRRIEPPLGLAGARQPNTIYEGTLIRTVLTRSLRTDLPGRITAKVMSDVYDSVTMNTLLIPRGSEVICTYQSELLTGQEVVLAACERLRLPNGKSFSLMGTPASDLQGAAGLPAEVNNHFWKMFKTSLMLGAASLLLPKGDQQITINNTMGSSQTAGSILGTALYDTIQQVLSRNAKINPTASVDIGTPFTLTIARDVEMEPYQGR